MNKVAQGTQYLSLTENQPKEQPQPDTLSQRSFYLLLTVYLIVGSSASIMLKIQNSQFTEIDGVMVQWRHPFTQSLFMFLGNSMCLIVYQLFIKEDHVKTLDGSKPKFNPLWLFIPSMFDLCTTFLIFFGLTLVAASIFQIFKGFIIISTAIISYLVLNRIQQLHQMLGIVLAIVGLLIVGINAYLNSPLEQNENMLAGMIMVISGQCFKSCHVVIEEVLLRNCDFHQFQITGYEAVFGLLFQAIILPLLQNVECHAHYCVNGKFGDSIMAFREIYHNRKILALLILYMFIAMTFNGAAITITRYSSAVHQVVIDQARIVIVWLFFLSYPGIAQETFSFTQLFGFIVLFVGNLIYNEILTYRNGKIQPSKRASRLPSANHSRAASRENSDDEDGKRKD